MWCLMEKIIDYASTFTSVQGNTRDICVTENNSISEVSFWYSTRIESKLPGDCSNVIYFVRRMSFIFLAKVAKHY